MSKENLLSCVPTMLLSSHPSHVFIGGITKLSSGELYIVPFKHQRTDVSGSISQHLHITSKRDISEGCWVIYSNELHKVISDPLNFKIDLDCNSDVDIDDCRKVEATTDPELIKGWIKDNDPEKKSTHTNIVTMMGVPSIPQSFLEEWVKQKGQIKEVLIEMVETVNYQGESHGKYRVKVTSSSSEVTIHLK